VRLSRLLLGAVAAVAAASGGPRVAAETYDPVYLVSSEGSVDHPQIKFWFPSGAVPRPSRVVLVESDVPRDQARRHEVRRGRVVGYLVPERTYDVFVLDARLGVPYATFPRGFTAHGPRFAELPTTAAARGETVYVRFEYATRKPRFRVNGVPARITHDSGAGHFGIEMPPSLSRAFPDATVTADVLGSTLIAPHPLDLLDEPRELSAVVDGARRSSTYETYEIADGRTTLFGRTTAVNSRRYAGQSFTVSVPADVSALQLPVTFTQADGASVSWANRRRRGAWMPGPRGLFHSASCTVTIESFDGGRIRGTFSARLDRVSDDAFAKSGDPFDVSDGRLSVDASLPTFERYADPYGVR